MAYLKEVARRLPQVIHSDDERKDSRSRLRSQSPQLSYCSTSSDRRASISSDLTELSSPSSSVFTHCSESCSQSSTSGSPISSGKPQAQNSNDSNRPRDTRAKSSCQHETARRKKRPKAKWHSPWHDEFLELEKEFLEHKRFLANWTMNEEPQSIRDRYGARPATRRDTFRRLQNRVKISELDTEHVGQEVVFRARIQRNRKLGSRLLFLLLRQQGTTIQGVLAEGEEVSTGMIYWARNLKPESIVLVRGVVQSPKSKDVRVTGASYSDLEILIDEIHIEASRAKAPPSKNKAEPRRPPRNRKDRKIFQISDRVRRPNQIPSLRTIASQALCRIRTGICSSLRSRLEERGFVKIHTPNFQWGATPPDASMSKFDFFDRQARLAHSRQFAKQMCIPSNFDKVFEIGPVFRAEYRTTHIRSVEFTGINVEMAIRSHYHEIIHVLDDALKSIFETVYQQFRKELNIIKRRFPHDDFIWLDETPIITFTNAVNMLNASGWRNDDGTELSPYRDLEPADEAQLGKLVKQQHGGTDFFILDKFPRTCMPFDTTPDPDDPRLANAFAFFLRGEEVLSGAQRIHDTRALLTNLDSMNVSCADMDEYIRSFEWGCRPHGGGRVGLERLIMVMFGLGGLSHEALFARDR